MEFPWQPLFSIERSGRREVTVSGIISIADPNGKRVFSHGDVDYSLWSRSCLKPWQLLDHMDVLKAHYPQFTSEHYALMMSSHSAEPKHLELLKDVMGAAGLNEENLHCPPAFPMNHRQRIELEDSGAKPKTIYNGCSGKHAGYMAAIKANGENVGDYLNKDGKHFDVLKAMLGWMLGKDADEFPVTVDGCHLPNYALSCLDMAYIYSLLMSDLTEELIEVMPKELKGVAAYWPEIKETMLKHPEIIAGKGRLDTRLMLGELSENPGASILAKQGADGLMAMAVSAPTLKHNIGCVVKIASGTDPKHMELLVKHLLTQFGINKPVSADERNKHLKTEFHFTIPKGFRQSVPTVVRRVAV